MSANQPTLREPLTGSLRPILMTVLRMVVSTWAVLTCYYTLPVQSESEKSDLPYLALQVAVFAVLVVVQIPVIMRSRHPGLRAIESMVLTVFVYLTLFARIYLSAALTDPLAFSQELTRTKALYFTVTTFTTVGFGDITAQIEATQVLVTVQMLLNLVVLGVVVRLLFTAGTRGMERRRRGDEPRSLTDLFHRTGRGGRSRSPEPSDQPPTGSTAPDPPEG